MAGLTVAASGAKTYRGRRAQRSLLYRTVQTHFETWLALRGGELNDARFGTRMKGEGVVQRRRALRERGSARRNLSGSPVM